MNDYRDFKQVRTPQLWMQRHGWWRPWYEFTDGQFSYGKFSFDGLTARAALFETLHNSWKVSNKSIWSFDQVITHTADGKVIGEVTQKWFKSDFNLTLADGSAFTLRRKSIWKGEYAWSDSSGNQIALISQHAFSSKSIRFTVEQQYLNHELTPLLLLLGTHLLFLTQRRAAAAAA
ncbi:hypothetical protein GCM10027037_12150 [Mucilaginibacter koreensis]